MNEYIGIDIGGTNIRIGVVDKNNKIVYLKKERTLENVNNVDDLYNKIKNMIKEIQNHDKCKAVGIGVPGAVDNGKILTARNLEYLIGFPLKEKLEEELKLKVYIENDAKIAALGEAINGIGKNNNIVCYVTISTGLGGGVVINNEIYHGSNNIGGYFSRMILDGENISEHLISGTALVNKAQKIINTNVTSTKEVFTLASNNNPFAIEIIKDFKKYLTVLLLNISITINPDIIILGGGVTKSKEYFLDDVKKEFYSKAQQLAKSTKIEVATLEEPGVIGAAILAKQKDNKI